MHGQQRSQPVQQGIWPDRPEFPLYVALKAYICRQQSSAEVQPRFTARRVINLVGRFANAPERDDLFVDLFQATPHLIRERLKNLNSGTVLKATGRGVRNALTYTWKERVPASAVQSYRQLQRLLDGEVHLSLDVYRLATEFDARPFTRQQFLELMIRQRDQFAKGAGFLGRLGGRTKPFTMFLVKRFEFLQEHGLIDWDPHGACRLTKTGHEVAHWFELFAYSVDYSAERQA